MRATQFQKAILAGDLDALADVLAPDVTFWSPAAHKPYEGHAAVMRMLTAAHHVLAGLTYTEAVESDERTVLFFTARVGGRDVEGIDALRFDAEGRVRELLVMIRPHSALEAVMAAMAERLGAP